MEAVILWTQVKMGNALLAPLPFSQPLWRHLGRPLVHPLWHPLGLLGGVFLAVPTRDLIGTCLLRLPFPSPCHLPLLLRGPLWPPWPFLHFQILFG